VSSSIPKPMQVRGIRNAIILTGFSGGSDNAQTAAYQKGPDYRVRADPDRAGRRI
jgi:hypothetical protein